jgi:hypothetical protein
MMGSHHFSHRWATPKSSTKEKIPGRIRGFFVFICVSLARIELTTFRTATGRSIH